MSRVDDFTVEIPPIRQIASPSLPDDPALPALGAIDEQGLGAVLARAGVLSDSSAAVTKVLLHHPGSRCTLLAATRGSSVIVKVLKRDISRQVATHELLLTAGLASGSPPTAAPVLGFDRDLRLLVMPYLGSRTVDDLVADGESVRAGELAAGWLRRVAAVAIEDIDVLPRPDVVSSMRRRVAKLAGVDAAFGREAATVADVLERRRDTLGPESLCHGAFRPQHVLDIGGPAVIDWDGAHRGHLAQDAGMFIAALRKPPRTRIQPRAGIDAAVQSFRAGIAGVVRDQDVAWYEAVATLRLAGYTARRGREKWRDRVRLQLSGAMELARAS